MSENERAERPQRFKPVVEYSNPNKPKKARQHATTATWIGLLAFGIVMVIVGIAASGSGDGPSPAMGLGILLIVLALMLRPVEKILAVLIDINRKLGE